MSLPVSAPVLAAPLDRLRHARSGALVHVLGIVAFALLTTLGAQVRIPLWEVPFTLQTLAVYGAGLFLGARSGLLSQLLYLAAGLVLPVFSGAEFGAVHLFGATGGYLLALPLVAYVTGRLTEDRRTWVATIGASLVAMVVLFGLGATWLHLVAGHDTWATTFARGVWPFVAGDLAKIGVATLAYAAARRL